MSNHKLVQEGLGSVNVDVQMDISRIQKLAGLANSATATGERVVGEAHELDHEVSMARGDVYSAARDAIRIYEMLTKISEQQGLEGWVQAKITKAADYVDTAADYIESNREQGVAEAKYQGREVKLGKPFLTPGGPKKRSVYVRNPKTGNIKKVNFGDPHMRIKKSSPKHRKSFRARHNCANPGPRTSARYWSCRAW